MKKNRNVWFFFENSEDSINIQKISEQTLLHVDIVTKLHEEFLNV